MPRATPSHTLIRRLAVGGLLIHVFAMPIAIADEEAPTETRRRETLENLNARVQSLRDCLQDSDCAPTGYDTLHCKSTCDACGIVIHRTEIATFKALQRQALEAGDVACPPGRCSRTNQRCKPICDLGICTGKNVPDAAPAPVSMPRPAPTPTPTVTAKKKSKHKPSAAAKAKKKSTAAAAKSKKIKSMTTASEKKTKRTTASVKPKSKSAGHPPQPEAKPKPTPDADTDR